MRVATLILSLGLMLVVGLQSCTVYIGGSALENPASAEGGALGVLIAILFLLGAAFVMVYPLVSLFCFVVAGLTGLAGGSSTSFSDLTIWGIVALILATLSFLGVREKRKRVQDI